MHSIFNFCKRIDKNKIIIYGYPVLVILSIIFIDALDVVGLLIVALFIPSFMKAVRGYKFESEKSRLFFVILNKLFIVVAVLFFCFVAVMLFVAATART